MTGAIPMFKKYIFFLSLYAMNAHCAHNLIESITIDKHTITYHVNEKLHTKYLRADLFVTYPDEVNLHNLDYTILTMPLIMNMAGVVWISGEDYHIHAMDKDLFESLKTVKEIFKRFYPATPLTGNLIPDNLVDNSLIWETKKTVDGIALPFSHGLDSLCTSMRLRKTPQLLITARGMPDTPLDVYDANWKTTKKIIAHFAQVHGHKTAFITSNFHEFFNWRILCRISPEITHWRICMVESLGWMGLAAPILITHGYKQFVLPANDDWESTHPGAGCPLVDESVIFAGITNTCDGFELPRLEKNRVIADICNENNIEKPFSMICEKVLPKRKNCCECEKCVASILSLLLLQEDPYEYGFYIDTQEFLHYFKQTYILENNYGPHALRTFQYCQKLAQKNMDKLDPKLQKFFSWYCNINFNAFATPSPRISLNYNDFTDLYDRIPLEVLKRNKKERSKKTKGARAS